MRHGRASKGKKSIRAFSQGVVMTVGAANRKDDCVTASEEFLLFENVRKLLAAKLVATLIESVDLCARWNRCKQRLIGFLLSHFETAIGSQSL